MLGVPVAGRSGQTAEIISPVPADCAHAHSISAIHGLADLPMHTELSHRPLPCSYVLLGCVDPGQPVVSTRIVRWSELAFSKEEIALLKSAPMFVRSGRRSFYATILPQSGEYVRYDTSCMEAIDRAGREALDVVARRLASFSPTKHVWTAGEVIAIDNWSVLHGRDPAADSSGRKLVRMMIDGR